MARMRAVPPTLQCYPHLRSIRRNDPRAWSVLVLRQDHDWTLFSDLTSNDHLLPLWLGLIFNLFET